MKTVADCRLSRRLTMDLKVVCRADRALRTIAVVLLGAVVVVGCQRRIEAPTINPAGTAAKVFTAFDRSQDGLLDLSELEACPGLHGAMDRYDANNDKSLSPEEIERRLTAVLDNRVGLLGVNCEVFLNGRPLPNAHVRMVPEAFLDDVVRPAEGDTDPAGVASMKLAGSAQGGIQIGIYRVEVTHSERKLPEKYNTNSILGCDVAPDVRGGDRVRLELKQ